MLIFFIYFKNGEKMSEILTYLLKKTAFILVSLIGITQAVASELPSEIISEGQWIVSDMDGTLIGAPGYQIEPNLDESVAKEAIFDWLRAGGQLFLLTSCETQRTHERFTQYFPEDLKSSMNERRLLIGTNGGAVISYFDGTQWIEDSNFQESAAPTRITVDPEDESLLLQNALTVINRFYQELRENPFLIPEHLRVKYKAAGEIANIKHPYDFTLEELITLNSDIVPRIEIRQAANGETVQICIIGIPAEINYDVSQLEMEKMKNLQMVKVGLTHELNIKGVDKALPVRWLQKGQAGYPELIAEKSVGFGDRPNHNDAPLTTSVGSFVSVCEFNTPSYIPAHVKLRVGNNQAGSKKVLEGLLQKANEFNHANRLEPVIVHALEEVVDEITNDAAN